MQRGMMYQTHLKPWPAPVESPPVEGQAAVVPATFEEFMDLSEALTDKVGPIEDEPGRQYFAALDNTAVANLLQRTIRLPNNAPDSFAGILATGALDDDGNAKTAQQILVFWYSGLVGTKTAAFVEALAWDKILKDTLEAEPPTEHIGFGDWSERP